MSDPTGTGQRFNPPPGWPVPPTGWTPPAGWVPDPSWPPAPPGWQFWIPVGYVATSAVAQPERKPFSGRFSLGVKILAGTITLAATILGTYVAVSDRPQPYTIQDWARKANAACERDFGSIQTSFFALTPLLARALAQGPTSGTGTDTYTQLIKTLGDTVAAYRALTGDVRAIDLPEKYDDAEVQKLLNAGGDIANALATVDTFLVSYEMGQADAAGAQRAADQLASVNTVSIPAWTASARKLGLAQCLAAAGFDGAIPSAAATTAPPAATLSAAEQELASGVNSAVLTGCVANRGEESATVVAAVNCRPVRTGPAKQPLVARFVSNDALSAWVAGLGAGYDTVSCSDGHYKDHWHRTSADNTSTVGALICGQTADGFKIIWTFDSVRIAVVMDAKDAQTANAWWSANAYLWPTAT